MTGNTTNITNTREKCAGCDNMCISRLTIMSGMDEARQNQIIDSAVCLDTTDCCMLPRQEIEDAINDPLARVAGFLSINN